MGLEPGVRDSYGLVLGVYFLGPAFFWEAAAWAKFLEERLGRHLRTIRLGHGRGGVVGLAWAGLVVLTFQVVYLDVLLEVSKWLVHGFVIPPIYHNKPMQGIISKHGLA